MLQVKTQLLDYSSEELILILLYNIMTQEQATYLV